MKVVALLQILGITEEDLSEEWHTQNSAILQMQVAATHPEHSHRFPVNPEHLCHVTGWERHDQVIALRCQHVR